MDTQPPIAKVTFVVYTLYSSLWYIYISYHISIVCYQSELTFGRGSLLQIGNFLWFNSNWPLVEKFWIVYNGILGIHMLWLILSLVQLLFVFILNSSS